MRRERQNSWLDLRKSAGERQEIGLSSSMLVFASCR
jgi:hypothetical protein